MTALSFPDQHIITGKEWQQFLEFTRPLYARKSVIEYRFNSTTLEDDQDLHVQLKANSVYRFVTFLKFVSDVGVDIRWSWNMPDGAIYYRMGALWVTETTLKGETDWSFAAGIYQVPGTVTASTAVFSPRGQVSTDVSGRMYFQWCQNVATASNTTLDAGSCLIAWRVA